MERCLVVCVTVHQRGDREGVCVCVRERDRLATSGSDHPVFQQATYSYVTDIHTASAQITQLSRFSPRLCELQDGIQQRSQTLQTFVC